MNDPGFTSERDRLAPALENIRKALSGLRYGTVTVVVQDGVIVQLDRTEKLRLPGEAARRS